MSVHSVRRPSTWPCLWHGASSGNNSSWWPAWRNSSGLEAQGSNFNTPGLPVNLRCFGIVVDLARRKGKHVCVFGNVSLMIPGNRALDGFLEIPGWIPSEHRARFFDGEREEGGFMWLLSIRAIFPFPGPHFQNLLHYSAHRQSGGGFGTEIECPGQ